MTHNDYAEAPDADELELDDEELLAKDALLLPEAAAAGAAAVRCHNLICSGNSCL